MSLKEKGMKMVKLGQHVKKHRITDKSAHQMFQKIKLQLQAYQTKLEKKERSIYEGRPINKFQNGIILLIFKIHKNPKYRFCTQFNWAYILKFL